MNTKGCSSRRIKLTQRLQAKQKVRELQRALKHLRKITLSQLHPRNKHRGSSDTTRYPCTKMSFAYLPSEAIGDMVTIERERWIEEITEKVPLEMAHRHTVRKFYLMLEWEGHKEEEEQNGTISIVTEHESRGESLYSFTGPEVYWRNGIRLKALREGIEHHIPVVYYVLRPETAITAVLHFLARELAGIKEYKQQRACIIQNPGLLNLVQGFWKTHTEIQWSGGMSPGVDNDMKQRLFLAIMECFIYTDQKGRGRDTLPVPHLSRAYLATLEVHIDPLQYDAPDLSERAREQVRETEKRNNAPGIPGILAGHVQCHICSKTFSNKREVTQHRVDSSCNDPTQCNGCGLKFPDGEEYLVHAYTFCKQGPISGAKCPSCNTAGPKCLCQVHWTRTFALIAAIWEGGHRRAEYLMEDREIAGTLILANMYVDPHLFNKTKEPVQTPPSPIQLRQSKWDETEIKIPPRVEEEGQICVRAMDQDAYPLDELMTLTIKTIGIKAKWFKVPDGESEGLQSARKIQTSVKIERRRYLGTEGIDAEDMTGEEITFLANKVKNTERAIDTEDKLETLSLELGMTKDQIQEGLTKMKTALAMAHQGSQEPLGAKPKVKRKLSYEEEDSEEEESEGEEKKKGMEENVKTAEASNTSWYMNRGDKRETTHRRAKIPEMGDTSRYAEGGDEQYYCRNESHRAENPPYRTFRTEIEKITHLIKRHKCPYKEMGCHEYYEYDTEMTKHILNKHKQKKEEKACHLCSAMMEETHMETHKKQIHSQCTGCSTWYVNPKELKAHWDQGGGACREKLMVQSVTTEQEEIIATPGTTTAATLPDRKIGIDDYITESFSIMADEMLKPESRDKIKGMMNMYSFQARQRADIQRNPYNAQSQTTPLLLPPKFKHPAGTKERPMDKLVEKANTTDLVPKTADRMENFLKMEQLNKKITNYVCQYYLNERSAVFLLLAHLGENCHYMLECILKRPLTELSYIEILQVLQTYYFNINLKTLREEVSNLRRAPNELMVNFYHRCYQAAYLASTNFQEPERTKWIEQKMREIIYRGLDQNIRMEIDNMETLHGIHMTSTDILKTFVDRANFRANPNETGESLFAIAKIEENRRDGTRTVEKPKSILKAEKRRPIRAVTRKMSAAQQEENEQPGIGKKETIAQNQHTEDNGQNGRRNWNPTARSRPYSDRKDQGRHNMRENTNDRHDNRMGYNKRGDDEARKAHRQPNESRIPFTDRKPWQETSRGADETPYKQDRRQETSTNRQNIPTGIEQRRPGQITNGKYVRPQEQRRDLPLGRSDDPRRRLRQDLPPKYTETDPRQAQGQLNMRGREQYNTRNGTRDPRRATPPRPRTGENRPTRTEGTEAMLAKLGLTGKKLSEVNLHCWACGAGHAQLGNQTYHKRGQCKMPMYHGEPHECRKGILLMHKEQDCPYKKEIRRIKHTIQD